MKTNQIRERFLQYFQQQGHAIVPGSSLVPDNDPSLLFTNAGMVQFKDIFTGLTHRTYTRATTAQRCMRVSGKHNDLDNVGYTARHHTFFEMLGNFSFGDYFKREAIGFAWTLLTKEFGLSPERLWVTVHNKDTEAESIWTQEIRVDPSHVARLSDNFWMMGDTGPCGPCSEIFYDFGPSVAGLPPGQGDGDRYVEIWNLVFMQYERDASGKLTRLPKPSIDTGMGLERISAVLQGVCSNYDTDTFQYLIGKAALLGGTTDLSSPSLKVIADHARACAFIILDGITPSNEGRGYVLRRIIRRAARHGHQLGIDQPFLSQLVQPVIDVMGQAYRDLLPAKAMIERVIHQEEEQFAETLSRGLGLFEDAVKVLSGKNIPGTVVFKLYDTYGFPVDLTESIARDRGLTIDHEGFSECMQQQKSRSKAASGFSAKSGTKDSQQTPTLFTGYEKLSDEATIIGLMSYSKRVVDCLHEGQAGTILLDRTPFYGSCGGQIGDRGKIRASGGAFEVRQTDRQGQTMLHEGTLSRGELKVGDRVTAEVDEASRQATAAHHSATHLLHHALREVLGTHVFQKGSLVAGDRLRLDFSHSKPIERAELDEIERRVNQAVTANLVTSTELLSLEEAKARGAMALFGEKYGETVRAVHLGEVSFEICGGTHVRQTGDIGFFKITSESGVAAGIRRIEAVVGMSALAWVQARDHLLAESAGVLKCSPEELLEKIVQGLEQRRECERLNREVHTRLSEARCGSLQAQAKEIGGVWFLAAEVPHCDFTGLKGLIDALKLVWDRAVIVLASREGESVQIVIGVSKGCVSEFSAKDLLQKGLVPVEGKGGGRVDLAQGAGKWGEKLPEAFRVVEAVIEEQGKKR